MVIRRMRLCCDEAAGECINHDFMTDIEAVCRMLDKLTQGHANAVAQLIKVLEVVEHGGPNEASNQVASTMPRE